MLKSLVLCACVSTCLISSAFAVDVGVVAVDVHGSCTQEILKRKIPVHAGETIPAGATVSTGKGASLKLVLPDHSSLSLAPATFLRLDPTKPGEPRVVSMGTGQVRAKITKDYVGEPDPKAKIKFFLRTKTATMGVRGTEFEVIHNSANQITSLLTFEGGVSMAQNDPQHLATSIADADHLLNSAKSVLVTEGKFSAANPSAPVVSIPVKISPVQFAALKSAEPSKSASAEHILGSSANARAGSPIPPGVDAKFFAATANVNPSKEKGPPPEGFFDRKSGAYAPPAGGFIDVRSGLYVPPPPGSAFDPNAGVFIPPPSLGTVDPKTGTYVPPTGYQLDPVKGFVPIGQETSSSGKTGAPVVVGLILPGSAVPVGITGSTTANSPAGLDVAPPTPVQDPYCPQCSYPQSGPATPPTTTTKFTFTTF